MTAPAQTETFGIHCVWVSGAAGPARDFTINTAAGNVSWTDGGIAFSSPARITPATIDWTYVNFQVLTVNYHIERATGELQIAWHYSYGNNPNPTASYRCTKLSGF